MPERVQVFEHDTLRVGEQGFTDHHFARLVIYNQQHGDRFFTVQHRALRFQQYVGVLQVGRLTIEVLPKADRAPRPDREQWRNVLIDMLRYCGYLPLSAAGQAHLCLRRASLFDLYLEVFLRAVADVQHRGLVKKYMRHRANAGALKGRLLFNEQLARNLVHRERLYVEYQHYTRDNRFNRILKRALDVVARCTPSAHLQGMARRQLLGFEEVADTPVTAQTFAGLRYDRNTERYREAMTLARLILLNYQPDIRAGGTEVLAILFDMNALFEEYVYRQLRQAATTDIRVTGQPSYRFWQAPGVQRHVRPDIVVDFAGRTERVVLDTKWKVPQRVHPDDDDLRQIYTYTTRIGASRGYLLYPRVDERADISGTYCLLYGNGSSSLSCGMQFIDLLADGSLKRQLGREILQALT